MKAAKEILETLMTLNQKQNHVIVERQSSGYLRLRLDRSQRQLDRIAQIKVRLDEALADMLTHEIKYYKHTGGILIRHTNHQDLMSRLIITLETLGLSLVTDGFLTDGSRESADRHPMVGILSIIGLKVAQIVLDRLAPKLLRSILNAASWLTYLFRIFCNRKFDKQAFAAAVLELIVEPIIIAAF